MAIATLIKELEKIFGEGIIFQLNGESSKLESIPTGSILLDEAIGIGGIPLGRIIEIYGNESSGKTSLCLHIIAEAQKLKYNCAFIDTEHSLDIKYAKNIGVQIEKLLVSQPDCGEQALDVVETLIKTGEIKLIVIDSVAALTPRAEIEGDFGDSHMGLQARLMSQALRKLTGIMSKASCSVIFTNQIRSKIGIVYGNPETTTGGNALKFYASVRLDMRKKAQIKVNETIIGNEILIKVVKNKVAAPFKEVNTAIIYGKGIWKGKELLNKMIVNNEIEKAGAWFKYKEEKIHGEDKMIQYIEKNIIKGIY